MNRKRIAQDPAAVENHFHSEALSDVEADGENFTDGLIWVALDANDPNRPFA